MSKSATRLVSSRWITSFLSGLLFKYVIQLCNTTVGGMYTSPKQISSLKVEIQY